jgi:hypothetical protein
VGVGLGDGGGTPGGELGFESEPQLASIKAATSRIHFRMK